MFSTSLADVFGGIGKGFSVQKKDLPILYIDSKLGYTPLAKYVWLGFLGT